MKVARAIRRAVLNFTYPSQTVVPESFGYASFNHHSKPLFPYLANDSFRKIVIRSVRLGDVIINRVLSDILHELCLSSALFAGAIKGQMLGSPIFVYELAKPCSSG